VKLLSKTFYKILWTQTFEWYVGIFAHSAIALIKALMITGLRFYRSISSITAKYTVTYPGRGKINIVTDQFNTTWGHSFKY